jgi:hypothetical protein
MDAGPPREELLQALGERGAAPTTVKSAAAAEEPYAMGTAGGKPPSWH